MFVRVYVCLHVCVCTRVCVYVCGCVRVKNQFSLKPFI